jgi:hypothetical protein
MGKDYYAILEVAKNADDNELKKGQWVQHRTGAAELNPEHGFNPGELSCMQHIASWP